MRVGNVGVALISKADGLISEGGRVMTRDHGEIDQVLARALAHQRAGELESAESLYDSVLEQLPDWPIALHYAGVLAYQKGDLTRARGLLERALAGDANTEDIVQGSLGERCPGEPR